jgi:hypothetical protein
MAIEPPTDDELNTLIRARLAGIGVDLSQLHPTQRDPVTGSPSQASVLSSLRSFLRGTVPAMSAWQPVVPSMPTVPPGSPDRDRLAQQQAAPALYPSILPAWTDGETG